MKTILTVLIPSLLWSDSAVLTSRRTPADFELTADAGSAQWYQIEGLLADSDYFGVPVPDHRTEVRSRWSPRHLYILFICQFDQLNLKPDASTEAETPQLWNWDVAETFLGADFSNIAHYKEFQVSPRGEWADLDIDRTKGARGAGAAWNSGMQVKARIDTARTIWYGEIKIPFEALIKGPPAPGRELRAGFFRIAGVDPAKKKITWRATGVKTFHVPEKFGILRLEN